MEQLTNIKQCLVSQVQGQLGNLEKVNAKEMGEVIDMIKDLEEAMYYCAITEAMEKSAEEKEHNMNVNYYMEGDMGRGYYGGGRMYYDGQARNSDGTYASSNNNGNSNRYYVPYMEYAPYMMRDDKWRNEHFGDRSGMSRRMYMEGKIYHGDDQQSMKELEHYIKDLGEDLTDMVKESSMEERQVLSSKLQQLATKINNSSNTK